MTPKKTLVLAAAGALATATLATGGVAQAAAPAPKASPHWFGDFDVNDHGGTGANPDRSTVVTTTKPNSGDALPFHSYATVVLYDCTGAEAWKSYGTGFNYKEFGKKWVTSPIARLSVPDVAGEYDRFEVTIHSKGRKPVTKTLTSSKHFTLGCNGGTTIEPTFESGLKPITSTPSARFDLSAEKAIASYARFGKVVGTARIGSSVRITGAKIVNKRAGHKAQCATVLSFTNAKKPLLGAADIAKCGKKVKIRSTMQFFKPLSGAERRSTVGAAMTANTVVGNGGHHFVRDFRVVKVKPKK